MVTFKNWGVTTEKNYAVAAVQLEQKSPSGYCQPKQGY